MADRVIDRIVDDLFRHVRGRENGFPYEGDEVEFMYRYWLTHWHVQGIQEMVAEWCGRIDGAD